MNKLYLNIHQFKYTTYIMNICIYIYSVILSIFLFVYIECSFAF